MTKHDLIANVAIKANISQKDAGAAIEAFVKTVLEATESGDKVQMIGFGTFETVERTARTGRNPQTGKAVEIPASKTLKFKASPTLKTAVE